MSTPKDILFREISVGDFVISYNYIYEVLALPLRVDADGFGTLRMVLVDKSNTTKPVRKYSSDVCIIDKNDVLVWKLKGG